VGGGGGGGGGVVRGGAGCKGGEGGVFLRSRHKSGGMGGERRRGGRHGSGEAEKNKNKKALDRHHGPIPASWGLGHASQATTNTASLHYAGRRWGGGACTTPSPSHTDARALRADPGRGSAVFLFAKYKRGGPHTGHHHRRPPCTHAQGLVCDVSIACGARSSAENPSCRARGEDSCAVSAERAGGCFFSFLRACVFACLLPLAPHARRHRAGRPAATPYKSVPRCPLFTHTHKTHLAAGGSESLHVWRKECGEGGRGRRGRSNGRVN